MKKVIGVYKLEVHHKQTNLIFLLQHSISITSITKTYPISSSVKHP